jgi:predicted nuclease with TOPRIM domain
VSDDISTTKQFITKVGVNLSAALLAAFVIGLSAVAVGIRDSVNISELDRNSVKSDISELRSEFNAFRNPGDRFTAAMGAKLEARIDKLEQADTVANEKCSELRYRVQQIEEKQKELCVRIKTCEHK